MLDRRRECKSCIGAPDAFGNIRTERGHSLNMSLVNDGIVKRGAGRTVVFPVEMGIGDDGFGNAGRAVAFVYDRIVSSGPVAEDRLIPIDLAGKSACVGVDQQLVAVEAMTFARRIWAAQTITVKLPRLYALQIAVPDIGCALFEAVPFSGFSVDLVEEAKLDGFCSFRIDREIHADAIPRGALEGTVFPVTVSASTDGGSTSYAMFTGSDVVDRTV